MSSVFVPAHTLLRHRPQKRQLATVYHSLYATVAHPDMHRWHKVNDTPSQNCIGSRVRIPQFDSAQKTQTGVVTGSKPTLAFTCYPPVPKPDMHLRTTQECSFATVYQSPYATLASPDMQRWHKVYDTQSHPFYLFNLSFDVEIYFCSVTHS